MQLVNSKTLGAVVDEPIHLQMLHEDNSLMDDSVWERCPADTKLNVAERKNQDSKSSLPQHLKITVVRLDKSVCAKHMAAKDRVSVT